MHTGKSPVNRLSVILFGAVQILLALALLGCSTRVCPQHLGKPRAGHRWARAGSSAGRRLLQGSVLPGEDPPHHIPQDGVFGTGPHTSPGTEGASNLAMAALMGGMGCLGWGTLQAPRNALPDGGYSFPVGALGVPEANYPNGLGLCEAAAIP